jgi:hypothetical protein
VSKKSQWTTQNQTQLTMSVPILYPLADVHARPDNRGKDEAKT